MTEVGMLAAIEIPPEVLVLGVVTGLTYGLLAVGLVLTYRASRVINFAHGQVGALAAVVLGVMVKQWGAPYWVAFAVALVVGAIVAALIEFTIVRRLRAAPPLMTLVATLGVAQFLFFLTASIGKKLTSGRLFPQPAGLPSADLGALRLTPAIMAMLVLAPVAVAGLALMLRRTAFGISLRASADNPDGARLLGIPAPAMRTATWALAGALATLTAALVLPAQGGVASTTEALGPTLMLRALAAGALAGMASLPVAFGAGIVLGVVDQIALWNTPTGGLSDVLVFGVLLAALLLRPVATGRLAARADWTALGRWPQLPPRARAIPLVRWAGRVLAGLALLATALLPLVLDGARELSATTVLCFAIVGLSVWVITGLGGQLSLGQFALAGVGATCTAVIAEGTGSPALGLAAAPVAGAVVAIALGLPALRSQEALLPVSTLGFAVAAQSWLLAQPWALGAGAQVERLRLGPLGTAKPSGAFLLSLLVLVGCLVLVSNLSRSGFGRRMRAVRDNEPAARAFGVPSALVRLQSFGVGGAVAALGGALLALALFQITPASFSARAGIDVVAMAVLGGLTVVAGPLVGALYIVALPVFVPISSAGLAATAFGWLLLVLFVPGGLAALLAPVRRRAIEAILRASGHDPALARPADEGPAGAEHALGVDAPALRVRPRDPAAEDDPPALVLDGLVRHFGGVHAVDGVSLELARGEVVGLVGPNGAGKTTLFDLATGAVAPQAGRVLLDGEDVTRLPTPARANRGLVRSFQDAALFPTLTVLEVVALGLERRDPTKLARAAAGLRSADRAKVARARELVGHLGLRRWEDTPVHQLSTGTRRVAELACLVALEPEVLLLDEPSAGLAQREAEALAELLAELRGALGAALLVIDHDLPLVLGLADRIVVLSEGRVVTQGAPAAIRDDPIALDALGMHPEPAPRDAGAPVAGAST